MCCTSTVLQRTHLELEKSHTVRIGTGVHLSWISSFCLFLPRYKITTRTLAASINRQELINNTICLTSQRCSRKLRWESWESHGRRSCVIWKKEENYRKLSWTSLRMSAYVLGQEASARKMECVMSSELWERRRQIKIPEPLVFSQFKKMDSGNVSRGCAA